MPKTPPGFRGGDGTAMSLFDLDSDGRILKVRANAPNEDQQLARLAPMLTSTNTTSTPDLVRDRGRTDQGRLCGARSVSIQV